MSNFGPSPTLLEELKKEPIVLEYPKPTPKQLDTIKRQDQPTQLIEQPGIFLAQAYYKQGIHGTSSNTFLRRKLIDAIQEALEIISSQYGFVIFDGFRSRQAQQGLFESFSQQIARQNPHLSEKELYDETRKYVAHPDEPSRFEVPPHLSGGSVDIGLTDKNGIPLNMGTEFDNLTDKASTLYFERPYDSTVGTDEKTWDEIRVNRRVLFNVLKKVGFTNWKHEWWHYDLGNCPWSHELELPWVYGEMTFPKQT